MGNTITIECKCLHCPEVNDIVFTRVQLVKYIQIIDDCNNAGDIKIV